MHAPLSRIRSWRLLGAGIAVLALALGGWAASQSSEPEPEIAAWLELGDPQASADSRTDADAARRLQSWRQTQAALLVSPDVLQAAVLDPKVEALALAAGRGDPSVWLRRAIRTRFISDTLLTVSIPDEPRERQAKILNAVVNAYLEASRFWESRRLKVQIEKGRAALADYQETLLQKRKQLRDPQLTEPERADALRDEIAVLAEVTRRLGIATEMARIESLQEPSVRVIATARP